MKEEKKLYCKSYGLIHKTQEIQIRRKKLFLLKKSCKVLPSHFDNNYTFNDIQKKFNNKNNLELKNLNIKVKISGRIIAIRIMGKASFLTLQDINGSIQLYISNKTLSNIEYKHYIQQLDIGDIIGVQGILFKTKTKQLSVFCNKITLLTKALRPLPNKFKGIVNKEIKYRKRYLDLISNEKSKKIFKLRSNIIYEIRKFMVKNKFIEVETPIMQKIAGGASSKPFITYHNQLNTNMYLRVSPELYLKRLIIGGFEKIFEINKNFRNEGVSSYHNPEFTMMELYAAYKNYKYLMCLIENLFFTLSKNILNNNFLSYQNHIFNLSEPFKRLTMQQAILKYNPNIHVNDFNDYKKLLKIISSFNIEVKKNWTIDHLIVKIFEKSVEPNLIQPTFITKYPIIVSPLARRNDVYPNLADRFELFIGGIEIGNGFSELNDSEDQKNRFKIQNNNYDNDYVVALEHGLPPTAGLGLGIDRLIMLFTNTTKIRDVILFPIYRTII